MEGVRTITELQKQKIVTVPFLPMIVIYGAVEKAKGGNLKPCQN